MDRNPNPQEASSDACPLDGSVQDVTLDPNVSAFGSASGSASGPASGSGRRTVVAMSGGVDSSVAAWLLSEEGVDLVGLFMRNGVEVEAAEAQKKSCCSLSDARDARMVAARLGIPFQAVDLKEEFGSIIRYFLSEYGKGRTPNPCAVCNRDLKFDRLLRFAEELGAGQRRDGTLRAAGGRRRPRPRASRRRSHEGPVLPTLLRRRGEPATHSPAPWAACRRARSARSPRRSASGPRRNPDSQEICFVPQNDYRKLLAEHEVELHPGRFVDTAGRELGRHKGTENFTIGQRRGLGLALGEPYYVVDLVPETGTVVLGLAEECTYRSIVTDAPNWIGLDPVGPEGRRVEVQVRYHHSAAPATVVPTEKGTLVTFDEPQHAVAPGQGAAFYQGDRLVGGGWIERAERVEAART